MPFQSLIFISYRRTDSGGYAGRLYASLASRFGPDQVFHDAHSLPPGERFPKRISEAVRQSRVVLVVIGPDWLHTSTEGARRIDKPDDWVRRELSDALEHHRQIVPVLVGGGRMPQRSDLPVELQQLTEHNALELSEARWRFDFAKLLAQLQQFGLTPPTPVAFQEVTQGARIEVREAWLTADDPESVRAKVEAFLPTVGFRIKERQNDTLLIEGGSKVFTRVFGALFLKCSNLSQKGRVRIQDMGAAVQVEVLLEEDWGHGIMSGVKKKYEECLRISLEGLRKATVVSLT